MTRLIYLNIDGRVRGPQLDSIWCTSLTENLTENNFEIEIGTYRLRQLIFVSTAAATDIAADVTFIEWNYRRI
jgi:hypothetical protein